MRDLSIVNVSDAYFPPAFDLPDTRLRVDSYISLLDDRVIIPSSGEFVYVDDRAHILREGRPRRLLGKLATHADDTVTYEELMLHIDGSLHEFRRRREDSLNHLNTAAYALRRIFDKVIPADLADDPGNTLVKSIRGQGYMLTLM